MKGNKPKKSGTIKRSSTAPPVGVAGGKKSKKQKHGGGCPWGSGKVENLSTAHLKALRDQLYRQNPNSKYLGIVEAVLARREEMAAKQQELVPGLQKREPKPKPEPVAKEEPAPPVVEGVAKVKKPRAPRKKKVVEPEEKASKTSASAPAVADNSPISISDLIQDVEQCIENAKDLARRIENLGVPRIAADLRSLYWNELKVMLETMKLSVGAEYILRSRDKDLIQELLGDFHEGVVKQAAFAINTDLGAEIRQEILDLENGLARCRRYFGA